MKDTAKAPRLFTASLLFLCLIGDGRVMADESRSNVETLAELTQTEDAAEAEVAPVQVDLSGVEGMIFNPFVTDPSFKLQTQEQTRVTTVADVEAAQSCAKFDPVANPGQILDILQQASKSSCKVINGENICTPVAALYGVWRIETGEVDGHGLSSGRCDVMRELTIRCAVGKACAHKRGMQKMADRFGWNLNHMTCSCGRSTMKKNNNYFGGCCGPFQFSAAEVVDQALQNGYDPMTLCGGAKIIAIELRDYYAHFRKAGNSERYSWRRAISRYAGSDTMGYHSRAQRHWENFRAWSRLGEETLRAKIAEEAKYSVLYHQRRRSRLASN
jgi:hypothetical protein